MNKLKSFFVGILLLASIFAMAVVTTLIYRASERSSVKSYIFQMANHSNQRLGTLQNLDDISANDLRNKLIKAYVSEYFKVIPGDTNVTHRPVLEMLSYPNVLSNWKSGEAKTIQEMSSKKMFRMVRVHDDGIVTYNKAENKEIDTAESVYYMVRYYISTWPESNTLETEPVYDQGTLYMEILFEPGLAQNANGDKINIKKYLESGNNPAGLFKFRVINIGDKVKR